MHTFCTLTSKYHISFTLALISKISEPIFILTLDEFSYSFFKKKNFKNIKIFKTGELKKRNLNKIKQNRSKLEFIYTLKSVFIYYLLSKKLKKNNYLIYLDSDIFFLQNSKYLTKKIKNYSIFLTKHNFSKLNKYMEIYGVYNAGFVAFKNDYYGLKYSKWWSDQCIKSCKFDIYKNNNIFTDQGYLNFIDEKSKKVKLLDNSIYNLGPWNLDNFKIKNTNGSLTSNKKKVIFFHFQSFRIFYGFLCLPGLFAYKVKKNKELIKTYVQYALLIKKNIINYKLNYPIINRPLITHLIRSVLKFDFKVILFKI